jgi:hypothetical protein
MKKRALGELIVLDTVICLSRRQITRRSAKGIGNGLTNCEAARLSFLYLTRRESSLRLNAKNSHWPEVASAHKRGNIFSCYYVEQF